MVLEWAESYQISVALRLGGLDVLEEGVRGGARRGEERRGKKKIIKQRCKDLHWQQKQTQEVGGGDGEEKEGDQPLFIEQI